MRPAGNFAVQPAALGHGYSQAAVIVRVVLRLRCRRVPLDRGPGELMRRSCRHARPVPGGRVDVSALVDRNAVAETLPGHAGLIEERKEELDQGWVAVDEADLLVDPVRLALRALAPVGDRAGHDDLAVRQLPELRCGGSGYGCPLSLPSGTLSGPIAPDTLGSPCPGLRIAQAGPAPAAAARP